MQNPDTALPDTFDNNRNHFNRLLKRLRIALLVWFVFFLLTVIWFTYAG